MKLWNFAHDTMHMHVYVLLAAVVLVIMVIAGLIHHSKQKKRDEQNEDELSRLGEGSVPGKDAAGEAAAEISAEAEGVEA